MKLVSPRDAEKRCRPVDLGSSLLGLGLFVVGVTSPLTPSRGCPSAAMIGVFAGGPVLLLSAIGLRRRGWVRSLHFLQAAVTTGAALGLLARIECLM